LQKIRVGRLKRRSSGQRVLVDVQNAEEDTWNMTVEVGSKVLVEAMTKYYGLS